jgi:hypothetical protein
MPESKRGYAKCISGHADAARRRIEEAMRQDGEDRRSAA